MPLLAWGVEAVAQSWIVLPWTLVEAAREEPLGRLTALAELAVR
jgi:hypothetical protein